MYFIHPSSMLTVSCTLGFLSQLSKSKAGYSRIKLPSCHIERQNSLSHSYTRTDNVEVPVCLGYMFSWTVGGSWGTCREPTQTKGDCANSSQKDSRWRMQLAWLQIFFRCNLGKLSQTTTSF